MKWVDIVDEDDLPKKLNTTFFCKRRSCTCDTDVPFINNCDKNNVCITRMLIIHEKPYLYSMIESEGIGKKFSEKGNFDSVLIGASAGRGGFYSPIMHFSAGIVKKFSKFSLEECE
jgi:hypothetical protein